MTCSRPAAGRIPRIRADLSGDVSGCTGPAAQHVVSTASGAALHVGASRVEECVWVPRLRHPHGYRPRAARRPLVQAQRPLSLFCRRIALHHLVVDDVRPVASRGVHQFSAFVCGFCSLLQVLSHGVPFVRADLPQKVAVSADAPPRATRAARTNAEDVVQVLGLVQLAHHLHRDPFLGEVRIGGYPTRIPGCAWSVLAVSDLGESGQRAQHRKHGPHVFLAQPHAAETLFVYPIRPHRCITCSAKADDDVVIRVP